MLEIGRSLQDARAGAGLDLSRISTATMIPVRYLVAMESEHFEVLPPGLYRRSFLREYAAFLGLDGDVYASEYELRFEAPELDEADPPPPPSPRTNRAAAGAFRALSPGRAAAVTVIALVGIGVWQLGGTSPPAAKTLGGGHAAIVSHRTAAGPSHHRIGATRPPAAPATLTLRTQSGACWLLVRVGSSSGPEVCEQTLQPGEVARFGLRKALWIRMGAPWNLVAKIGSRSVTAMLPTTTGEIVARSTGLTPS
jgi:hypothetical protein